MSGKILSSTHKALHVLMRAMLQTTIISLVFLSVQASLHASELAVKAPKVLLVDDKTGTVLFSRDADTRFPPASLAKLMTAEVVFEALQRGVIQLQDSYQVSEHAWRTGGAPSRGTTMFAKLKSSPTVEDLIQGMVVQLANDACIILAEGIAGSETQFVERMNERAQLLGLKNSYYVNSTGLPAEGQYVSAHDLTELARHIYHQYPQFYPYYAQSDFTWNKIFQRNKNPLLNTDIGADGVVIGGTEDSGFAIVASAEQQGRRLFLTLAGLKTIKERTEEAQRLLEWGMRSFDDIRLFAQNNIVGQAQVFNGVEQNVPLVVKNNLDLLLHKDGLSRLSAEITYRGPLIAPVQADLMIGTLKVKSDDKIIKEVPVYTLNSVALGNMEERSWGALVEIATGWIRNLH